MRAKTCHSETGVEILYHDINDGGTDEPLVFLGGLGGTYLIWSALTKHMRKRHRIIIWDYPGLSYGKNLSPEDPTDVATLAKYQQIVLDETGIERACVVGWSLGPQVAFEFIKNHSHRISGLVALCGVAGKPFLDDEREEPLAAALGLRSSVPNAVGWLTERFDRIEKFKAVLQKIESPTKWGKRLGFIDPTVDELVFDAVIRDYIALDQKTYRRYVESAANHDASDSLDQIDIPVILMAGQRDRFVKASRMYELSQKIKDAEYYEVKGATHFLPIEYAELVALKIDDFLQRRLKK